MFNKFIWSVINSILGSLIICVMGSTRTRCSDEDTAMTRISPDDEQTVNDEEMKAIQWC